MKKCIIALLVLALFLGLTSCSVDMLKKTAEITGKGKNNVYGIAVNTEEATAAASALATTDFSSDEAVSDAAKSLINSISDIKGSDQKLDALKAELAKPADVEKKDLEDRVDAFASAVASVPTSGLTEEQKEVVESVQAALEEMKAAISDEPTQADLAMVAVISHIAITAQDLATKTDDLVQDGELTDEGLGTVDSALGALDALKVISEVSEINLLGDLDATTLLSKFAGGASASTTLTQED